MEACYQQQYELIRGARAALLDYCATLAPAHFVAPLDAYHQHSIRDLLVHVAGAYYRWLGQVALRRPPDLPSSASAPDVAAVRALFARVDELMADFGRHFGGQWVRPDSFTVPGQSAPLALTPQHLFTHVITHEFHHKGQILTMSRLLGYTPVDTDVIRF